MKHKNRNMLIVLILAVSLLSASVTAVFITNAYNRTLFRRMEGICQNIDQTQPDWKPTLLAAIKADQNDPVPEGEEWILRSYGYTEADFLLFPQIQGIYYAVSAMLAAGLLLLLPLRYWNKKKENRIQAITAYLSQVNTNRLGLIMQREEDLFSGLQDEIYKTVTMLDQEREMAHKAKLKYADHLADIAHQLKTPIAAANLFAQMIENNLRRDRDVQGDRKREQDNAELSNSIQPYAQQIQKQLLRLSHLEESLLLLARIDAGTLPLKQEKVDVFTALTLAADCLEESLTAAGVDVDIPEGEAVEFVGDLEWTMEAFINLIKNCMEHAPRGSRIHCKYEQNPLYIEILIRDEGPGFAKEEIPHLFDRFYQGTAGLHSGVGIGLSIAKSIIELEHGMISARNFMEGGACFALRFYKDSMQSH